MLSPIRCSVVAPATWPWQNRPVPRIAVVIVTYDDASDLPACFDAMRAQDEDDFELIVVDNASRDGSADIARREGRGLPLRVLRSDENVGFAAGMNRGIAASDAPCVLSLNADTRPRPEFLSRLLARMDAHPTLRVGAVTGRLLRFPRDGRPPTLDACGMRLTITWRHLDRGAGEPDHGQWSTPERVFGGTGAGTLYRREALEDVAVDGEIFDPRFHSFREDAELAFRLREREWETLYEPRATALHRRRNLPERRRLMPAAVNYHSLKNRYLLRLYHQTATNLLWTLPAVLARDLAALLYVLLREPESRAAYGWLWRNRAALWKRRRRIQSRRTLPSRQLDGWFLRPSRTL